VYVMIFIPHFWVVKIGYTGTRRGINKRASSVSKAAPGIAIPVGAMILPFAWHTEQALHGLFGGLRWSFYKGDGHTETFLFPAHIVVVVVWFGMWLNLKAAEWVMNVVFQYYQP
jgi:hypothetical protein